MRRPNNNMSKEELLERLESLSLEVLSITKPLLRNVETRDMAVQVRRSVTGAFANYGAACVGRSHADFASKLGVALDEMDETKRWLRLLGRAGLLTADGQLQEASELRAILSASHLTAKRNQRRS